MKTKEEKKKKYDKEYYEKNKEKIREWGRKYYLKKKMENNKLDKV